MCGYPDTDAIWTGLESLNTMPQCQADSSSHDDAGGRELSALRAGLPEADYKRFLFPEPTISISAQVPVVQVLPR